MGGGKKGMRCCKNATVYKIYTPTPLAHSLDHLEIQIKKNPQEG